MKNSSSIGFYYDILDLHGDDVFGWRTSIMDCTAPSLGKTTLCRTGNPLAAANLHMRKYLV